MLDTKTNCTNSWSELGSQIPSFGFQLCFSQTGGDLSASLRVREFVNPSLHRLVGMSISANLATRLVHRLLIPPLQPFSLAVFLLDDIYEVTDLLPQSFVFQKRNSTVGFLWQERKGKWRPRSLPYK